jgi:hypothetical protein
VQVLGVPEQPVAPAALKAYRLPSNETGWFPGRAEEGTVNLAENAPVDEVAAVATWVPLKSTVTVSLAPNPVPFTVTFEVATRPCAPVLTRQGQRQSEMKYLPSITIVSEANHWPHCLAHCAPRLGGRPEAA